MAVRSLSYAVPQPPRLGRLRVDEAKRFAGAGDPPSSVDLYLALEPRRCFEDRPDAQIRAFMASVRCDCFRARAGAGRAIAMATFRPLGSDPPEPRDRVVGVSRAIDQIIPCPHWAAPSRRQQRSPAVTLALGTL